MCSSFHHSGNATPHRGLAHQHSTRAHQQQQQQQHMTHQHISQPLVRLQDAQPTHVPLPRVQLLLHQLPCQLPFCCGCLLANCADGFLPMGSQCGWVHACLLSSFMQLLCMLPGAIHQVWPASAVHAKQLRTPSQSCIVLSTVIRGCTFRILIQARRCISSLSALLQMTYSTIKEATADIIETYHMCSACIG